MDLERIAERVGPLAVLGDPRNIVVWDIAYHHEHVVAGSLYCCLPGASADGHDYAAEAVRRGAVALICEHSVGPDIGAAVQLVVAPGGARRAMALASCALYSDPGTSLETIGVTGTNGKTTTTYLLAAILERHGCKTGVIGTLDGVRTTPEAPELQRSLARQRDGGCVASALEVTSHAIAQHRVDGIRFDVAVFTNLSQDHLDYHHTMESYFAVKAELFTPERAAAGVVNLDDAFGRRLADRSPLDCAGYSLADAVDLEVGIEASTWTWEGHPVRLALGGIFNVANALAASTAARVLGVPAETIAAGLGDAQGVPGRFEQVRTSDGLTVIVDYAHTPAALEQVLLAARPSADAPARLFVVFGCGGDRDRGKRPAMGAVADRLADVVVLTSDNPRSEDPLAIISDIRAGIRAEVAAPGPGVPGPGVPSPGVPVRTTCVVEPDRRRAILRAVGEARPGDVVVVAGKGHETTQQFADHAVRFDDREAVRGGLARAGRTLVGPPVPGEGRS